MEWISVNESLPADRVVVLVIDESFARMDLNDAKYFTAPIRPAGMRFGMYISDLECMRVEGTNGNCKITHWMPLPPLPQTEPKVNVAKIK
jgi:hypothetical protein